MRWQASFINVSGVLRYGVPLRGVARFAADLLSAEAGEEWSQNVLLDGEPNQIRFV